MSAYHGWRATTIRHVVTVRRWVDTRWIGRQPRRQRHADAGVIAPRSGAATRAAIRSGASTVPTSGVCPGLLQANVVMLPATLADDFRYMLWPARPGASVAKRPTQLAPPEASYIMLPHPHIH